MSVQGVWISSSGKIKMNQRISESPGAEVYTSPPPYSFSARWSRTRSSSEAAARHWEFISPLLETVSDPAIREEFHSIAQIPHEEEFAESLLNLGQRSETRRDFSTAMNCYTRLAQAAPTDGLRRRAQQRLEVLRGGGSFGAQVEFLSRQFVDQALDPAMLVGMGVAGATFQGVRLAAFTRLATTPAGGFLTRGLGARGLAWTVGFAAEFPAFTMSVRGVREAMGVSQDWSGEALRRDLLSSGLTLFALKGMGLAGETAMRRIAAGQPTGNAWIRFSGRALPQAAMFTGILGAHQAEAALGWRESTGLGASLVQSLAILLQFNVGGHLANGFPTPHFARTSYERLRDHPDLGALLTPQQPRVLTALATPEGVEMGHILMMAGDRSSSRPPPPFITMGGSDRTPIRETLSGESLEAFQALKTDMGQIEKDLVLLYSPRVQAESWGETARICAEKMDGIVLRARDIIAKNQPDAEELHFLHDISEDLQAISRHLRSGEASAAGESSHLPHVKSMEVQRFLTYLYGSANKLINFIDGTDSIVHPLNNLRYARTWLEKSLQIDLQIGDQTPADYPVFPYLRVDNGSFELPKANLTVAILGDRMGLRTSEVAQQGHEVLHFDPNLRYLQLAQRSIERWDREAKEQGRVLELKVHYIHHDGFGAPAKAEVVESYYPSILERIPPRSSPQRRTALDFFLQNALNNKLVANGSGFVISDRDDAITDLAQLIREDPSLRLLEVQRAQTQLPLVGGQGATSEKGEDLVSWLVYRRIISGASQP